MKDSERINAFYFITHITDLHTPNSRMGGMAVAATALAAVVVVVVIGTPTWK
jgi:hypothetical protein